ncbi:MAG TPA: N-acetylmuramoyl-L-alanine amidase [Rhodothermales bacterium]|nr:N-acetylmuramoyl-L-alanine amidase [Rhodothermales bacterium]
MKRLLLFALFLFVAAPAQAQLYGDMVHATVTLDAPQIEQAGKTNTYTFESGPINGSFNGIVLQGFAPADTKGWIRFAEPTGWTDWLPLRLIPSATDDTFAGGYRGEIFRDDQRFELRFSSEGTVSLSGAGVFDNRKDADYTARQRAGEAEIFTPADGLIIPPVMNARSEWGAEPFKGTPSPLANPSYNAITFHHAAGYRADTEAEGLQQLKAIQELHQDVRGWSDIGYQFVMDQSGRLYQGRPFLTQVALEDLPRLALGAHVGGHNTGNIGVCVLGCYHPPEPGFPCNDVMTPAAIDSLVTMFAFLSEAYEVAPESIRGHRDWSGASTACPGNNNHEMIPEIISKVENLLITGNQNQEETPTTYTLTESFPNPTTGSATIRYFLEQDGTVLLSVYDVLGREVMQLEKAFREAGRVYERTFDGRDLSAGTYFYRLQVEGFSGIVFSETQTITLIK